ncbi:MAG: HK97 family phage prohead protease [Actinomycetia bacterium]|nr:HK97 family phage prohead protease [Actinomycetes bacterium]
MRTPHPSAGRRAAAGTLRLSLDSVGLTYDADLPSSRADVYELVTRGDVSKSSFAFIAFEDDWGVTDQGFPLRTLLSGRLVDVAPVNTPAYTASSASSIQVPMAVMLPLAWSTAKPFYLNRLS